MSTTCICQSSNLLQSRKQVNILSKSTIITVGNVHFWIVAKLLQCRHLFKTSNQASLVKETVLRDRIARTTSDDEHVPIEYDAMGMSSFFHVTHF